MSNYRHGHGTRGKVTATYRSWMAMKRRCDNPNTDNYQYYGARGVTYDPRWATYVNFLEDMGERPEGTTLDRQDPAGNYCKANCSWATKQEQSSHGRGVKLTEYKVIVIKMLYRAKNPACSDRKFAAVLAPMVGVSDEAVRAIIQGRHWAHV